ncbi:MAG: hypothetical protein PHF67_05685 [Candidatus Nanoarchaeia archaeon]|nr:hypothetical protein [Candidatus Nanoarchaeia archaeon]
MTGEYEDRSRRDGRPFREKHSLTGREETYRINPETGVKETLVQGGVGLYWAESSAVLRSEWGPEFDIDFS